MPSQEYPYQYFSGANVSIFLDNDSLIECAGISFIVNESNQPAYGYASTLYDVVLPGRRIVQGTFVVNFHTGPEQHKLIKNNLFSSSFLNDKPIFDIGISYGLNTNTNTNTNITLKDCFLISRGQTIQISENVILEEYGFVARNIEGDA